MPQDYFGERIAQTYEAKWPELFDPAVIDPAVGFLADLAGTGAALEFGVGTGRIALPLSRRGVRVHGVDLSPAMVARLRASPGAQSVAVTIGDFATAGVDGTFSLVYLVRNTITNLTTQEEQVACFRNAAAHLTPGGCFVIENYWPAELDLMAQLAGMSLRERWADWHRAPYTGDSESHISVWRRDG
jgi:SAM-dependent methyltransferase